MNLKSILLVTGLFVAATAFAQEEKKQLNNIGNENTNQGEFKFNETEFDFGTIKQGDKVTKDFEFVNSGKEPLIISEAHGSCGCTVPQWPKEPVAKGAKAVIHVEFNSTGKMGMQDKTVTITSNAKSGSKVLHLKGNVEAPPPAKDAESPVEKK